MADPADADVIRTIERDAVPGQRAIGGGELVAARAGVGGLQLHPNVDRGLLASRQVDSHARLIGEALLRGADIIASDRKGNHLILPDRACNSSSRGSCVKVVCCYGRSLNDTASRIGDPAG